MKFNATENSGAQIRTVVSGVGRIKVYVNGILHSSHDLSQKLELWLPVYVEKGENRVEFDISSANSFVVSTCLVYGFAEKIDYGSKVFTANAESRSLVGFYNGLEKRLDAEVWDGVVLSNVLSRSCLGAAASLLPGGKVIVAARKSDKISMYLIDLSVSDVTASADVAIDGALDIGGASGGAFYVITADKSVVKLSATENLMFSQQDLGYHANKVICAPSGDEVIFIEKNGKAVLVSDI